MYNAGRKKGTVRFAVQPNGGTRKVELLGDFTGWKPVQMRKQKNGQFVAVVPVEPGCWEYKLLVDGEWTLDPDNSRCAVSPQGTVNSVVVAEGHPAASKRDGDPE